MLASLWEDKIILPKIWFVGSKKPQTNLGSSHAYPPVSIMCLIHLTETNWKSILCTKAAEIQPKTCTEEDEKQMDSSRGMCWEPLRAAPSLTVGTILRNITWSCLIPPHCCSTFPLLFCSLLFHWHIQIMCVIVKHLFSQPVNQSFN